MIHWKHKKVKLKNRHFIQAASSSFLVCRKKCNCSVVAAGKRECYSNKVYLHLPVFFVSTFSCGPAPSRGHLFCTEYGLRTGYREVFLDMGDKQSNSERGPKKALRWAIPAGICAVLAAAYLGLCFWVSASGRILPNVTLAGLPVGGMTQAEMEQVVEAKLPAWQMEDALVELTCGNWRGELSSRYATLDLDATFQAAHSCGRGSLLASGFHYVRAAVADGFEAFPSIALDDEGTAKFNQLMREALELLGGASNQPTWVVEGDELLLTKGVTGTSFDTQLVLNTVCHSMASLFDNPSASPVVLALKDYYTEQTPPAELDFEQLRQEVCAEPKSAALDPDTYQILDHVVGIDFDLDTAKRSYDSADEGETVSVALTLTQPNITKEVLQTSLFADLLGQATSAVSGSANRRHNVALSAASCNGAILLPGEEFSYNNTTGSRTTAAGYLPAPAYVNGKTEDEIGGGICQTSSTIYNAILYTTLEVVERRNHMYAVGYVLDGMDATVYYGAVDFRFKNNSEYPIKIVTQSYDSNGKRYLTVKIYGTKTDDLTIKLDSVSYDWTSDETQYVADTSLSAGTQVVEQTAYSGRKAYVVRYFYDSSGNLVKTEKLSADTYRSRPKIVLYNPVDAVSLGLKPAPSTSTPSTETPQGETPNQGSASTSGTPPEEEATTPSLPDPSSHSSGSTSTGTNGDTPAASSEIDLSRPPAGF